MVGGRVGRPTKKRVKGNGRQVKIYGTTEDVYKNVKEYIKEKIKILSDFRIKLSDEEIEHINSLTNEVDVDRFAHRLILERL